MKQKPERSTKRKVVNVFGSLGYLFCFLQWFWAVMAYFSVIQSAAVFVSPDAGQPVEPSHFTFTQPNPLEAIILAIVTVLMIGVTIYVLIKTPVKIAKTSSKIVHKTTESVVPLVIKSQHKKDTKRLRDRITSKLVIMFKILLILIPAAATVLSGLLDSRPLDYSIILVLAAGLTGFSVLFFGLQYLLAAALRIKLSDLW